MIGIKEYEEIYKSRIERIIKDNSDIDFLEGFYYYTCNAKLNGLSSSYNYILKAIDFIRTVNKPIDQFSLDDYSIYLGRIKDKSSSYQITTYSALKKLSKYLYGSKRVPENYMEFIDRPKNIQSIETLEKREKGYLDKKEVKKYITRVDLGAGSHKARMRQMEWKERDRAIILLFLTTGLRCSGLYKLDINSIDFNSGILRTIEKGNKIREVELDEEVINVLMSWINKRNEIIGDELVDALFISNRKQRLSQRSISDIVTKYSEDIPNKKISPHKLRATYGTLLYNETKDIRLVQECMGHSSSHTTERYIRGKNKERKDASSILIQYIK